MRLTVGMALHTIAEFRNAGVHMGHTIFLGIVRVAVVARVFRVSLSVTRRAGDLAFAAVIDRECVLLQLRRCPGHDRVAGRTIGTKHPLVNLGIGMARRAIGLGLCEIAVGVALRTLNLRVTSNQSECVMIKRIELLMTGQTIGAVLSHVFIDKGVVDLTMACFTG